MNDGHAFIGIEPPRHAFAAIDGLQRAVAAAARQAGGRADTIPRRHLVLPLEDLGPVRAEALEAVELAIDRAIAGLAPFSVQLTGLDAAPAQGPRVARLLIDDDRGRLAALRDVLHRHLARYGFPLEAGDWRPHLPIARLDGVAALPPIDAPARAGALRVARLVVFRRDLEDPRGARFRPVSIRPLDQPHDDTLTTEAGLDAWRAEIAAELDARLDRRRQQIDEDPTRAHRPRRPRRRAS